MDPIADSEKYFSWIELTGFSLLFSFGQNHDPEKFFFPFYDLLALFFPSIPCCFLTFRPRTYLPLLNFQVFISSVLKIQICSFPKPFFGSSSSSSKISFWKIPDFPKTLFPLNAIWRVSSDKFDIRPNKLVTFSACSRFIPALEINRLWKEWLLIFFWDSSKFFFPIWGRHLLLVFLVFFKVLWFRSYFKTVHRENLRSLNQTSHPFGNCPFCREAKLGFS